LVKIGTSSIEPLIKALQNEDGNVQIYSAWALGKIKDIRAVEPLIALFRDSPWEIIQEKTAEALGKIKDARAVEPLIDLIRKEKTNLRTFVLTGVHHPNEEAVWALGEIKDKRALEPLNQVLQVLNEILIAKERGSIDDYYKEVILTLGKFKDSSSIPILIAAMKTRDIDFPSGIAGVLVKIGTPSVEPLIELIEATSGKAKSLADVVLIERAAWALGQIRDTRAVDPLNKLLLSKEFRGFPVIGTSAKALGNLRDGRSVEPLINALTDAIPQVRANAAWALGEIRDKRALDALNTTRRDRDSSVREAAEEAIAKITGRNLGEERIQKYLEEQRRFIEKYESK
jgi:HEAT repeat protein